MHNAEVAIYEAFEAHGGAFIPTPVIYGCCRMKSVTDDAAYIVMEDLSETTRHKTQAAAEKLNYNQLVQVIYGSIV